MLFEKYFIYFMRPPDNTFPSYISSMHLIISNCFINKLLVNCFWHCLKSLSLYFMQYIVLIFVFLSLSFVMRLFGFCQFSNSTYNRSHWINQTTTHKKKQLKARNRIKLLNEPHNGSVSYNTIDANLRSGKCEWN